MCKINISTIYLLKQLHLSKHLLQANSSQVCLSLKHSSYCAGLSQIRKHRLEDADIRYSESGGWIPTV
jgi:hypothetical protein